VYEKSMIAAEHLRAYLTKNQLTQIAFARNAGVNPGDLSQYLRGLKRPGLSAASKIQAATGGQVKAVMWAV